MNRPPRSGYKCQMRSKLQAQQGDEGEASPPRPTAFRSSYVVAGLAGFLLAALASLAAFAPEAAWAKVPPSLRGPIATVGDRTVEAIDIQNAAKSLGADPPKGVTPKAWRRTLLERCVDREILAAEANRRGLGDDPEVRHATTERQYDILMRLVYDKVLIPGIRPTPEEFAAIKKSGRYRYLDLDYILLRDDASQGRRSVAVKIAERARNGARWDSLAKIYSGHPPSAAAGGHFGSVLVKELEPASQDSIAYASVGTVFGPYFGPYGHEIYKVGGWYDMDDDSMMRLLLDERTRGIYQNYWDRVLKKYHYKVDSLNAANAMVVLRSESPDSILASLSPDGTRPSLGVRIGFGVLARADGGIVLTMADLLGAQRGAENEEHHLEVKSRLYFDTLLARLIIHQLIVRDVREQGLDKDPDVARALRLAEDQASTYAMVRRSRPPDPDAKTLAAYAQKNAARYQHPAVRLARVVMFDNPDTALAALRSWNGIGIPADSTWANKTWGPDKDRQFCRVRPNRPDGRGVDPASVYPGNVVTVEVTENSTDPLAMSLRGLSPGQFAPMTACIRGYAVAMMTGRREAAPMSDTEAAPLALGDWREEMEDQWVTDQLERLRATTPVSVFPARLEAVRIAPPVTAAPPRRRTAAQ